MLALARDDGLSSTTYSLEETPESRSGRGLCHNLTVRDRTEYNAFAKECCYGEFGCTQESSGWQEYEATVRIGVAYLPGMQGDDPKYSTAASRLLVRNCPNKSRTVLFGYNSVNRESAQA